MSTPRRSRVSARTRCPWGSSDGPAPRGPPRSGRRVDRRRLLGDPGPVEVDGQPGPRGPGPARRRAAGRRAPGRPPRPARGRRRAANDTPGLPVDHHLAEPARRGRHQRRPGRRRLQRDDPERLVAAGQHHRVGRREGGAPARRRAGGRGSVTLRRTRCARAVSTSRSAPPCRCPPRAAGCRGGPGGSGGAPRSGPGSPFSYSSRAEGEQQRRAVAGAAWRPRRAPRAHPPLAAA